MAAGQPDRQDSGLRGSRTDKQTGKQAYRLLRRKGLEPGIGGLVDASASAAGGKDFSVAAVQAVTETSLEEGADDDRCLLLLCAQEE